MIQVTERVRIPSAFEVPASQLYGWVGRVEVAYNYYGTDVRAGRWSKLVAVRRSNYQGIDVVLEDATLQACFPESATYVVRHVGIH